jgi:hypothetical protein
LVIFILDWKDDQLKKDGGERGTYRSINLKGEKGELMWINFLGIRDWPLSRFRRLQRLRQPDQRVGTGANVTKLFTTVIYGFT